MFPAKFVTGIWKHSFVMRIKVFHQRYLNLGNSELALNENYSLAFKRSAVCRRKGHQLKRFYLTGAAIVNVLIPGPSKTFMEYSQGVFLPFVKGQFQHVRRVDVVWEIYIADSLKAITRNKRGKAIRRRVKPDTKIPGNWADFLSVDERKEELFHFLADQLVSVEAEHEQVISTKRGRYLLHAADAGKCSFKKIML